MEQRVELGPDDACLGGRLVVVDEAVNDDHPVFRCDALAVFRLICDAVTVLLVPVVGDTAVGHDQAPAGFPEGQGFIQGG